MSGRHAGATKKQANVDRYGVNVRQVHEEEDMIAGAEDASQAGDENGGEFSETGSQTEDGTKVWMLQDGSTPVFRAGKKNLRKNPRLNRRQRGEDSDRENREHGEEEEEEEEEESDEEEPQPLLLDAATPVRPVATRAPRRAAEPAPVEVPTPRRAPRAAPAPPKETNKTSAAKESSPGVHLSTVQLLCLLGAIAALVVALFFLVPSRTIITGFEQQGGQVWLDDVIQNNPALKHMDTRLTGVADSISSLDAKFKTHDSSLQDLDRRIAENNQKINAAQTESASRFSSLEKQLQESHHHLKTLDQSLSELSTSHQQLAQSFATLQDGLGKLRSDISTKVTEGGVSDIVKPLLEQAISGVIAKLNKLQDEVDGLPAGTPSDAPASSADTEKLRKEFGKLAESIQELKASVLLANNFEERWSKSLEAALAKPHIQDALHQAIKAKIQDTPAATIDEQHVVDEVLKIVLEKAQREKNDVDVEALKKRVVALEAVDPATKEHVAAQLSQHEATIKAYVAVEINRKVTSGSGVSVGLPDFALYRTGSRVVKKYTGWDPKYSWRGSSSFLDMIMGSHSPAGSVSPNIALDTSLTPGDCWPFPGPAANFTVQLPCPLQPTAFTIDHIPSNEAIDPNSLPREFTVSGFNEPGKANETKLTSGTYQKDGQIAQTFQVSHPTDRYFTHFTLSIGSNYGGKFTCLYRFRVHGNSLPSCQQDHVIVAAPNPSS